MNDSLEKFEGLSVTGSVAYRERIAMPPRAVLTVSLLDVSRADAAAEMVSQIAVPDPGNVPIEFELVYDPDTIVARNRYAVRATITVEDRLWWTTDTAQHVITNGNPSVITLWLVRVAG